jgi:hypothetical protein
MTEGGGGREAGTPYMAIGKQKRNPLLGRLPRGMPKNFGGLERGYPKARRAALKTAAMAVRIKPQKGGDR